MVTRDSNIKVSSELNAETNEMEVVSLKVENIDIPIDPASKKDLDSIVEEIDAEIKKIKTTVSLVSGLAIAGIILGIFAIILGAINNYQKKVEVPEFDDQRYTVEHNSSSMYSSFSTVTDNETGKKYLMVITPNGVNLTEME